MRGRVCAGIGALLLALVGMTTPGTAAPISVQRDGRIALAEGPEPVGGVAAGDSFSVTATFDSDDLTGVGAESLLFDGVNLLGGSLTITVGGATFTELDTPATTQLLFEDGELVGYDYIAPFSTPLGAGYFLVLRGTQLVQSFSTLPMGVAETSVEGVVVPEPSSALLVLVGLLALATRSRRSGRAGSRRA